MNIHGVHLNNLRYADDVILILETAETAEDLQEILTGLYRENLKNK